ncbi:MAG: molybdopterin-dependent oxidoreductase [Magnetococcales bacterium]|nr:molybdopterin-dependent oxidoreductase [Magnetococcales bacterium]
MRAHEHPTTCPLDCPGSCALIVTHDGNRISRIVGNPAHPFTRGVICGKVARYGDIQHGPRIASPLLRHGPKGSGSFQPISWDEAFDHIVARMQEIIASLGPEAIFPYYYGGTMGMVQRAACDRLTHRAGFSRLNKTICYPISETGWLAGVGRVMGPNPIELQDSDLIVLWGINAVSTHINLMPFIKEARQRGARLVVIDPYRNRTARLADVHLAIQPGCDAALALAMMNVIVTEGMVDRAYLQQRSDYDHALEQHILRCTPEWAANITGLESEVIRQLARWYGTAQAPFIRIGMGMSRHANGAVNVHAITCLVTLTGAWQRRGGGALLATGDAFPTTDAPVRQPGWLQPQRRLLDMSRLGDWLTDTTLAPPIAMLLIFNANPAASCPDASRVIRGLQRPDLFTVVHEQVMSDTARQADLVLPATTFLEHEDLYKSYGQYTLQHAQPLLPPWQQARCNHDVVNELARRLGYQEEPFQWDVATMVRQVLQASQLPPPETWSAPWLDFTPSEDEAHFRHRFGHADGRFHFYPHWSDANMPRLPDHWPVNRYDQPEQRRRYPLRLLLPPAHDLLNTTFAAAAAPRQRHGPPTLWLHPEDATARGIGAESQVTVYNDQASLTMAVRITTDVTVGLCLCEAGYLAEDFPEGLPINALTHASPVAPAGGAAFHDNCVEVRVAQSTGGMD